MQTVNSRTATLAPTELPQPLTWRWTHERVSRLLLGISILTGLTLGYFVTPWAYLVLVGTSLNLLQFAFTGRCVIKDMLDRLGVPYDEPPAHLVRRVAGPSTPQEEQSHD